MTGPDEIPFGRVLRDLFAAYGKTPTAEQAESYFAGLEDLPLPALERAMATAKQQSRWCPTVQVIRSCVRTEQATVNARPEVLSAIQAGEVVCQRCDDTGWEVTQRPVPANTHEHYLPGATRGYARPCGCQATNGIYQYRRASERRWTAGGAE